MYAQKSIAVIQKISNVNKDIRYFSNALCQNTSFKNQFTRMEGIPQKDASRKRHLTPVPGGTRIVVQKMEGFDKGDVELSYDGQNQKACNDFGLTELFTETHVTTQVSSDGLIVPSKCDMAKSHDGQKGSSDDIAESTVNDAVDEDISVEVDTGSDVQMSLDEVTAQVKVSRAVFAALKTGDRVLRSKLAETGCSVQLPKKMKKPVTVIGSSKEGVRFASDLLKADVAGGKRVRPQLTHFVSLRLTEEPLRRRFEEFRALVRDLQPDQDLLPDRLFQRPEKLHISISMLRLPDEEALEAARAVLDTCCRQLRDQPPAEFRLRGLGTFGSAGRSRVLFSRPEPAERLQAAAELVHSRLSEAGLTARQQDDITLHATLLNTTFLTRGAAGRRWRKFRGFDHGPIVEQLGEFDFGEVRPAALELSSLTEKAADGYYASVGRGLLNDLASPCPGSPRLRPATGEPHSDADGRKNSSDEESDSGASVEIAVMPSSPPKDSQRDTAVTAVNSQGPSRISS